MSERERERESQSLIKALTHNCSYHLTRLKKKKKESPLPPPNEVSLFDHPLSLKTDTHQVPL